MAGPATASLISWSTTEYANISNPTGVGKTITGIDQLDQTGTLEYAVNLGGGVVTLVQSLDPHIDFEASDPDLDISAFSGSGSIPRPDLILGTAVWEAIANLSTAIPLTLNNLTPGETYRIQGLFATPYNVNPRRRVVIDGVDYGEGSPGYVPGRSGSYGDARLMTGVFTADGTGSQSFTVGGNVVGASGPSMISALVLHTTNVIPEPSSAALLVLGGLALLLRRRR